jgi:hypothetical protein
MGGMKKREEGKTIISTVGRIIGLGCTEVMSYL